MKPAPPVYWLEQVSWYGEHLEWSPTMKLETELCPLDPTHAARTLVPHELHLQSSGGVRYDFSWTWYGEAIVSPAVAELFRGEGVTGCRFVPVIMHDTTGLETSEELYHFVPEGWGGVAPRASGIRRVKHCSECGASKFTAWTKPEALFPTKGWDESEVFVIWPLPKHFFITERVKSILDEAYLTGFNLRPLAELRLPPLIRDLSPGSLEGHAGHCKWAVVDDDSRRALQELD